LVSTQERLRTRFCCLPAAALLLPIHDTEMPTADLRLRFVTREEPPRTLQLQRQYLYFLPVKQVN
jgi:hypothetical protein